MYISQLLTNLLALPDCSYTSAKQDVTVIAMDDILFSRSSSDCQRFCDDARAFNCRSYAQLEDRCYLSGDDSVNLEGVPQPVEIGAVYKEKVCTRSKLFWCSRARSPLSSWRHHMGSGCGSVGGAVASDIRGPRFEPSHRHLVDVLSVNCIEKTKK